jgi:CBS domain-containing protein
MTRQSKWEDPAMKAADIMTTSIITIGPNARVSDVAE